MLKSHRCNQPLHGTKQWFNDSDNDLFLWLDTHTQIIAFQYCYNKLETEQVISWSLQHGYNHGSIDNGEDVHLQIKMSPIMVSGHAADYTQVAERFLQASEALDTNLAEFIYRKLLLHR